MWACLSTGARDTRSPPKQQVVASSRIVGSDAVKMPHRYVINTQISCQRFHRPDVSVRSDNVVESSAMPQPWEGIPRIPDQPPAIPVYTTAAIGL